jgi:septal ring factor EnvC (AmiA/AmiB activator)
MSESTVPQREEEQVVRSADILLFRPRPTPAQVPSETVSEPQQRLARALDSLNAAMAAQRDAMAQWRASLAELKTTTSGLGQSLERYRSNLDALGKDVASLHRQAKRLQAWAEKPIAAE